MTKAELVNAVAISTGYDKTTIMNIVESAMEVLDALPPVAPAFPVE